MQQIKSILIGWIETSRLCISFNKVSWGYLVQNPIDTSMVENKYFKIFLVNLVLSLNLVTRNLYCPLSLLYMLW